MGEIAGQINQWAADCEMHFSHVDRVVMSLPENVSACQKKISNPICNGLCAHSEEQIIGTCGVTISSPDRLSACQERD